ncbi:MAG: hypothetical protein IR158_12505 [Cellulomonas sp.]|uniref:hypothetical protein n=1 Tax=Cellulomonas sp. TaxID=40001 RepID=UPI0019DDD6D4|nr:hypothetical protein [Cellulomonas sp.]MBF0688570.1 hypothetical protein [Cellulomonas sp.]
MTLHAPEEAEEARLTLEVVSSALDPKDWDELSGLLTRRDSRVVFNPGGVASGPNGPIVRFDLKWVSWLTDESEQLASLVVTDAQ